MRDKHVNLGHIINKYVINISSNCYMYMIYVQQAYTMAVALCCVARFLHVPEFLAAACLLCRAVVCIYVTYKEHIVAEVAAAAQQTQSFPVNHILPVTKHPKKRVIFLVERLFVFSR